MLDDAVHNSSTVDVHRNEDNNDLLNSLDEINIDFESGYSIGIKTAEMIAGILQIEENDRTTVGQSADTDTLVASANAYLNALNKMLIKREKKAPSQNIKHQKVKGI